MNAFARRTVNLLLCLAGCAVALAIGEMFLRWHNPFETRIRAGRIVLPVNRTYTFTNTKIRGLDRLIVHRRNSLGLRGPERPADGQGLEIIAVGGSTTECFYLSEGRTWPDRLSGRLAERVPGLWLNNAGLDGHSTFGNRILLRDYLIPLKPDVVLFLVGANDVEWEGLSVFDKETVPGPLDLRSWKGLCRSLAAHSEIGHLALNGMRALNARLHGLGHVPVELRDGLFVTVGTDRIDAAIRRQEPYLGAYRERLRGLIGLCRQALITPVLITQPTFLGPRMEWDDAPGGVRLIDGRGTDAEEYWRVLECYNDVTRALGEQEGVLVIDAARRMPKRWSLYYDWLHYTNAGAEVFGGIVFDDLYPYLRERGYLHSAPDGGDFAP